MTTTTARLVLLFLALVFSFDAGTSTRAQGDHHQPKDQDMFVQYLEIVTPDVSATCDALEKLHGVSFGEPDAAVGNARTAALKGGGKIAVRAPMREDEEPVVRPYVLVEDLATAVKEAEAAGAEIAIPHMEIPGHGKIAIYLLGGIQYGLWEL